MCVDHKLVYGSGMHVFYQVSMLVQYKILATCRTIHNLQKTNKRKITLLSTSDS